MEEKMLNRVWQLGIVVKDLEKGIEHWRALGAPEFSVFDLSSSKKTCGEVKLRGKPHMVEARVAAAEVYGTQIELIQPLDGHSLYAEHLNECGEGVHHLGIDTGDKPFAEVKAYFQAKYGYPIFEGVGAKFLFAYFDCRKELGTIIEIFAPKPE